MPHSEGSLIVFGMHPALSLSTSWLAHRHEDGYSLLKAVADLGFSHVELSHNIPGSLIPGILKGVAEGIIRISSVHNFCPLPEGYAKASPNLYKPSSWKITERRAWLKHSLASLNFAEKVGALALVCHLGSVEFFFSNPVNQLQQIARQASTLALSENAAYQKVFKETLESIYKKEAKALARVKTCLEPLLAQAEKKGIMIGVENREGLLELPTERQLLPFIQSFANPYIGYWHDAGHAQIKAQHSLLEPSKHLAKLSSRLVGFHLHDTSAQGVDHQAIGSGTVDFKQLSSYIKPHHLVVLEFSPKVSQEEVLASRECIQKYISAKP